MDRFSLPCRRSCGVRQLVGGRRPVLLSLPVGLGLSAAHQQRPEILKFIEESFPEPNIIGRANDYRSNQFKYKELVLVGHSEGGLLLRKVIVEAAERDSNILKFMRDAKYGQLPQPKMDGMLQAKVRLFAPALGGDMQSGLVGVLAGLPVISHALTSSAAKKGMDQGSPAVTESRRRTDRYAEFIWFDCFRAHIIWAEKDSIINSEKYTEDKQCHNFPTGSSHKSVCKPSLTYTLPLAFVEEGVDRYESKWLRLPRGGNQEIPLRRPRRAAYS